LDDSEESDVRWLGLALDCAVLGVDAPPPLLRRVLGEPNLTRLVRRTHRDSRTGFALADRHED